MRFNFCYATACTPEQSKRRAYVVLDARKSVFRQVRERLLRPA